MGRCLRQSTPARATVTDLDVILDGGKLQFTSEEEEQIVMATPLGSVDCVQQYRRARGGPKP